jgi:myosin V
MDLCILQDIQRYKLTDARSFHYLNQSSCIEVDGINDAEEYLATRRAMDIVGINEEEQVCIIVLKVLKMSFL